MHAGREGTASLRISEGNERMKKALAAPDRWTEGVEEEKRGRGGMLLKRNGRKSFLGASFPYIKGIRQPEFVLSWPAAQLLLF
ncbi:hypothetical protein JTE90_010997 [Oedothorax gibbosus]|uniref:Uncharacterized protein n=1 Tax=Oedothorax gibbosus TaxID=931172 RepID=A0AAV6VEG7_9ARAC|nr:hypothetical protein JTE90_010997 [Oedothorax gibbosus]